MSITKAKYRKFEHIIRTLDGELDSYDKFLRLAETDRVRALYVLNEAERIKKNERIEENA